MVQSTAPTVAQYLASLPPERRACMAKVRTAVQRAMPKGYTESMGYGMICWTVPLSVLPQTYNEEPLCYAALAAQKNHTALYLMGPCGDPTLLPVATYVAMYQKARRKR